MYIYIYIYTYIGKLNKSIEKEKGEKDFTPKYINKLNLYKNQQSSFGKKKVGKGIKKNKIT